MVDDRKQARLARSLRDPGTQDRAGLNGRLGGSRRSRACTRGRVQRTRDLLPDAPKHGSSRIDRSRPTLGRPHQGSPTEPGPRTSGLASVGDARSPMITPGPTATGRSGDRPGSLETDQLLTDRHSLKDVIERLAYELDLAIGHVWKNRQ